VTARYDVVVPSAGRPALARLVAALSQQIGPAPERVIVVDDRPASEAGAIDLGPAAAELRAPVEVVRGGGRGPAAARNLGWRHGSAAWIAFLDDDVVPEPDWSDRLALDLRVLGADVAASQGRIRVPLPARRRPTDRERCVAGLEDAVWATADMAYRRRVLVELGGFDERFPRAYREDADLGMRATGAGHPIVRGGRTVVHPVGPAGPFASVGLQAGNADDVLMRALHGRGWRERAGAPAGRRPRHFATVAGALVAAAAAARGHRRLATTAAVGWAVGTCELAWARIAPGPRTAREVATMVATSVLIPPAAVLHSVRGLLELSVDLRRDGPRPDAVPPEAILLDRDGTLVVDVPYNGDPEAVRPMPGAAAAVARLRRAGIQTAVVSNQSGIGRGLLSVDRVEAVNRRVEELLGPLGPWVVCPHAPEARCGCRKPAPGLVLRAARLLGTDPSRCVLIGDIGTDVEAARAAGARAILVPTELTRREEIAAAPEVARDLPAAVDLLLGGTAA
jgi:histidinol-phosphate phosphatase family protein